MRLLPSRVKNSPEGLNFRAVWARRLEGLGLVVPSVGMAVLATWLAVPQPIAPACLPLPTLEPSALESARGRLLQLAVVDAKRPLSFEVRALGERFRQLGRASFAGTSLSRDERIRFGSQLREVLSREPPVALLRLRALETELFLEALGKFESTAVISEDLKELGGDFLRAAAQHGWYSPNARRPRVRLSADERRALFLGRWNELTLAAEIPEFRLEPVWTLVASIPRLSRPLDELDEGELPLIDKVAQASADYPSELAKGLLLLSRGKPESAIAQFQLFLSTHPDGPYNLRARCHLLYAVEKLKPSGT